MKIGILPQTQPGKWSVGLILAFFLLFGLFQLLVASGQRGGATIFDNMLLTVPIFAAGAAGIASFITGFMSMFRRGERSVLVFLATAVGFFVLFFVVGEFAFPH